VEAEMTPPEWIVHLVGAAILAGTTALAFFAV
jgi:hypothetical protein